MEGRITIPHASRVLSLAAPYPTSGILGQQQVRYFILGYAEINDPRARRLGAAFHRKHLFDIAPPHPIWCTTCGSQSNLVEQLSYREELVLMIYG